MQAPALLVTHHCVPLGRRALHQLRASLERDTGMQSATYLQEAGFAGGEEVFDAFVPWLKSTYDVEHPRELDSRHFGEVHLPLLRRVGLGLAGQLAPDAGGHGARLHRLVRGRQGAPAPPIPPVT